MADIKSQDAQYTYQATQIATATKEQLLLILYDIGIRACRIAVSALDKDGKAQDYDLANTEILRAQDVIRELMVTLNTEKGGEMARGLMQLYDYMYQQLVTANVRKEAKNVAVVLSMLEELKETWEEALVKLLKEYQQAHPEDEDLKVVKEAKSLKDLENAAAKPKAEAARPKTEAAPPAPAPGKNKTGGLNIAG
ncbi:MAG: flagellar export chaperone FliS [Synergistaceae bacterium]|jgi:flagellar protein FliS|nr:flagellar export chaperone FliS [Synergistaceae bacterium]